MTRYRALLTRLRKTRVRSPRLPIARAASLAAAGLAAALVAAVGAGGGDVRAQSLGSVSDAVDYVERTLKRVCEDPRRSRFAEIREDVARSDCRVAISDGAFVLDVSYRLARQVDTVGGGAPAVLTKTVLLSADASFVCSAFRDDGTSWLFMSCSRDAAVSEDLCARRVHETRGGALGGRQTTDLIRSFEHLITLPTEQCEAIRERLNFIASRTRYSDYESARRRFLE